MVHRYALGGSRELRIARSARDELIVISVHDVDRCASGPLALPAAALDTLRSALADVAGETGNTEASEPEHPATPARHRARSTR